MGTLALKNAQWEHFSQLVAAGKNPTEAYTLAGYSKGGAAQSSRRLLKVAQVEQRIAYLREAIAKPAREAAIEKAAVTQTWVLTRLMQLAERTMPPDPNDPDAKPNPYMNPAAARAALALLGKQAGMFQETRHLTVKKLGELSDAECAALLAEDDNLDPDAGEGEGGAGS